MIYDRRTKQVVGSAGLMEAGPTTGLVSIAVDESKQAGIGTEAEYLLLKYGFEKLGYQSVVASVTRGNIASMRLSAVRP